MTPCPDCAEHLETIRTLGERCDRLVIEREEAWAALALDREKIINLRTALIPFTTLRRYDTAVDRIEAARVLADNDIEGANAADYSAALGRLAEARAEGFADGLAKRADTALAALTQIAAFDDTLANRHLEANGSAALFDEPCAVLIARAALTEMQRVRGVLPAVATSSGGGARCHPPADGE